MTVFNMKINRMKDERGSLVLKKLILMCINLKKLAEIHGEYGKQN